MVIREKGPNDTWPNALSPNSVTAGAPCPQTDEPDAAASAGPA